jgi:hypothetical protein
VRPERVELASVKKMRKETPSKKDDAVRVARKAKTPRVTRKEKSRNRVPSYSAIISRRPCWNGYHGRVTPSSFAKLMPYHTAALVENA